jgi:hypothetical protein
MLAQSREQADEKENRRKDDLRSNYIEKIKGLIKLTEREEGQQTPGRSGSGMVEKKERIAPTNARGAGGEAKGTMQS